MESEMAGVTPTNHSALPWISVQLMTHSGDLKYLARAIKSLLAQDIDLKQVELQIVHDGPVDPEEFEKAMLGVPPLAVFFGASLHDTKEKYGYYTTPRNQWFPTLTGFYVVHMDADNEFEPPHLSGLLEAVRTPDPEQGLPHFAYTRRNYVNDMDRPAPCEGPSPLVPWTREAAQRILAGPMSNFIDTGDFIVGRAAMFYLSEKTGCIWNAGIRRFGDHELLSRMAGLGFRGRAVDQVSHTYHWRGDNVQLTRKLSLETFALTEEQYLAMEPFRKKESIQ